MIKITPFHINDTAFTEAKKHKTLVLNVKKSCRLTNHIQSTQPMNSETLFSPPRDQQHSTTSKELSEGKKRLQCNRKPHCQVQMTTI
mmetsp:Transcript_21522/g.28318  ORF Transcript_21522/g.28318 Transcript_21522/m.28318 type:complete len:87 (-) Transcript_21522:283-543(-)